MSSRKQAARRKPYDVDNPKNWTTAKLKRELTSLNINFPSTARHAILVNLYQNRATAHTIGAPEVGNEDPIIQSIEENGGAHGQSTIDRNTAALESMATAFGLMTENIERLHNRVESVEKQLPVPRNNELNDNSIIIETHQQVMGINENQPLFQPAQGMNSQAIRSSVIRPGSMMPSAAAGSEAQLNHPTYNLHTAYGTDFRHQSPSPR